MGMFRKIQEVSAINFDPKGGEKGAPRDPGPPTQIGLRNRLLYIKPLKNMDKY